MAIQFEFPSTNINREGEFSLSRSWKHLVHSLKKRKMILFKSKILTIKQHSYTHAIKGKGTLSSLPVLWRPEKGHLVPILRFKFSS
jgi:hypothetical protein